MCVAVNQRQNVSNAKPGIMTGELAPARHVPSAATRNLEPGSNPPHDASLVAATASKPT
jgi:hypothetical protein